MIVVCSRCLTFVVGHIFVVSNVCSRDCRCHARV